MTNVLPGSRRDSVQLEKSASRITLLKTSPGAAHKIWVIILPLEMGVKVVLKHEREKVPMLAKRGLLARLIPGS